MLASPEGYSHVGDVLRVVIENLRPTPKVQAVKTRDAFGRIAAQDISSPVNVPRYASSHMDGYAVITEDLGGASASRPATLRVTGRGILGRRSAPKIRRGEAVRVATGGRVPGGSDAVIPTESTEEREGRIVVTFSPRPGEWVFPAGGDIRRGERILSAGQPIRAQDVGLLMALGVAEVTVRKMPTVSVIATGSELTDSVRPARGKTTNSHSPVFARLCEAQGCRALNMGAVGDDPEAVASAIRRSLSISDFVMTLGGTSVGRHDVVGAAVEALRPSCAFHGIRMDRGRVTGVAVVGGKPVLMMPGPIQGSMNAFILLGVPIIRHLSGKVERDLFFPCVMAEDWTARARFAHFQKVIYVRLRAGEEMVAEPLQGETESLKILTEADGYLWVPEDVTRIPKGSRVMVRTLPGFSGA